MQAHFHITFELNGENYSLFFLFRLPNIMVDIPLLIPTIVFGCRSGVDNYMVADSLRMKLNNLLYCVGSNIQ
jgi:hypothetical protein